MAHRRPGTEGRIHAAGRRRLAPCRDRPSVGTIGNEDAEIRPSSIDEGAEGDATGIVEPDPFGEPGEDAARRCRIAGAKEEMHGRLGRRDKDGAERRAQLDYGRKRDGAPAVDDRCADP